MPDVEKAFNGRTFWPVPLLLAIGVLLFLAGTRGSLPMLLLGTVTLGGTLYVFIRQIVSRGGILRSPDREALEEDLSGAESFLGGWVYLGKDRLFSSFSGKTYRCEAVRDLRRRSPGRPAARRSRI